MNKKIQKIGIIIGIIIVMIIIVLIVIIVNWQAVKKIPERNSENIVVDMELIKKNNLGPTVQVKDGALTPKSFMVTYPSEVSLALVSDSKTHKIIFDSRAGIGEIKLASNEVKTITFTTPEPGEYDFYCATGNHQEKGELSKMIVSLKPTELGDISKKNLVPGAKMVVNNGLIQPNTFTVAAEAQILLGFSSSGRQAHQIVFDDSTIETGDLSFDFSKEKSISFKTPKPGTYSFRCVTPGHEGETGRMIVK